MRFTLNDLAFFKNFRNKKIGGGGRLEIIAFQDRKLNATSLNVENCYCLYKFMDERFGTNRFVKQSS